MSDEVTCCWIGGWRNRPCQAPAEWIIVSGERDCDMTYACTQHVGELLCDAPEQRIYHYEPPPYDGECLDD